MGEGRGSLEPIKVFGREKAPSLLLGPLNITENGGGGTQTPQSGWPRPFSFRKINLNFRAQPPKCCHLARYWQGWMLPGKLVAGGRRPRMPPTPQGQGVWVRVSVRYWRFTGPTRGVALGQDDRGLSKVCPSHKGTRWPDFKGSLYPKLASLWEGLDPPWGLSGWRPPIQP